MAETPAETDGSRRADWRAWAVAAVVVVAGLMVLWPVSGGAMPRSADHQVHLARAQMFWEVLRTGHLRGWSDQWFFGTPIGELYPPLADLLVVGIRGLTLGLASWERAYAMAFALAFVVQGLAMVRAGRAMGLGPIPGLVAGLLILLDPGWSREGGWIYTVWFGVWPQVLANALCWLSFAELAFALGPRPQAGSDAEHSDAWLAPQHPDRHLALAALWLGLALLAHPIALPMAVVGMPTLALAMAGSPRTHRLWSGLARAGVVLVTGLAIGAWWLVPMLTHRAWMASYGWLHDPLATLAKRAAEGHWTLLMPAAAGHLASIGLLLAILPLAGWLGRTIGLEAASKTAQAADAPFVAGRRFWRFCAAFGLGMWLLSSRDLYWGLRLDLLSQGFTHIQYQRFLIAAKPAFFLLCGGVIAQLAVMALPRLGPVQPEGPPRMATGLRVTCALIALVCLGLIARDLGREARRAERSAHIALDRPQTLRFDGQPEFDADYADFIAWVNARPPEERGRFAFMDSRNTHWFMDFTLQTGLPLYKAGFTPGDNFVHKPESRHPAILDALDVRYTVTRGSRRTQRDPEVATFGSIRVHARSSSASSYPAWLRLQGPGALGDARVEVVGGQVQAGELDLQVTDAPPGTMLIAAIGAYPRWEVRVDGQLVERYEAPVYGDASPEPFATRASGQLRGGKANGDTGREPTLLAVPVEGNALVSLRYVPRTATDVLAGLVSLLALVGTALWCWRPPSTLIDGLDARLAKLRPVWALVPAALLLVVLGGRWQAHARMEAPTLHAAVEGRGPSGVKAKLAGQARTGPLKADMTIHPAIVLAGSAPRGEAIIEFDALPPSLEGWYALDDDWAKGAPKALRRLTVTLDGHDTELFHEQVPHRPGRSTFTVDLSPYAGQPGVIRVTITGTKRRVPRFGFDLDLEPDPFPDPTARTDPP